MKVKMNVGLQGHYRIIVSKDPEMKEVVQDTGFFENIITNAGLHALASFRSSAQNDNAFRSAFFKRMYLGSGTTTPTAEDESLENLGATGTSLTYFSVGASPSLVFGESRGVKMKKKFNKGDFVGKLSEVGLGVTDDGVLFSRALVVNESGTPSPITVTENDYLTVIYTVRQYVPFPKTFNITASIDGVPTPTEVLVQPWAEKDKGGDYLYWGIHPGQLVLTGTTMYQAWNDTTDDFQSNLANKVGHMVGHAEAFTPYDAENKPFESWVKLVIDENSWIGTIKTVAIKGLPGSWQLRFTPQIVKTSGKTMEIEFGVKLGRYEG